MTSAKPFVIPKRVIWEAYQQVKVNRGAAGIDGYRRGKSAHDALVVTRKRCWELDWVLEYDIRGLFDNIDHNLLLKALRHHCQNRWVLLPVERWLTAPMQSRDGVQESRSVGTPQGDPLTPTTK